MPFRRALHLFALLAGAAGAIAGGLLVAGYVRGAVLDRLGEPDQSLLFWYLPLLLLGGALFAAGVGAVLWGALRLRSARRPRR